MRIGFYLNNERYKDIDLSKPELGNPGIGGTEYMLLLISKYLCNSHDVYMFTSVLNNICDNTRNIQVNTFDDVISSANQEEIDYLICRPFNSKKEYDLLNNLKCKVIIWGHNFSQFSILNYIANTDKIVKYICVSKQQQLLLQGHKIYKKAITINNAIVSDIFKINRETKEKSICYIGSISKTRNVDILCKIWRRLYDDGIKIDFHIVGSGKLYSYNTKLGKYGIAKQEYEKQIVPYITEKNGNVIDNVHLYGVLGHKEKVNVINKSYIGISASETETFGISAIEFGILGVPFIALKTCGYKEIIKTGKNGYLVDNEDELYKICKDILNEKVDYKAMSNEAIALSKKFDIHRIIEDWNLLFVDLANNTNELGKKNGIKKLSLFRRIINIIKLKAYIQ